MTTQEKTQIIERFELFWGEAPEGSLKHKRGQEVLAHLLKEIEDAEERTRINTIKEIVEELYRKFVIASLSDREGEAKPEILKDGGDYVVSNEERKKIM